MASQRPFLSLRFDFPGRTILYNCLQELREGLESIDDEIADIGIDLVQGGNSIEKMLA